MPNLLIKGRRTDDDRCKIYEILRSELGTYTKKIKYMTVICSTKEEDAK